MLRIIADVAVPGYILAGLVFAILTGLVLTKWRGRLRSGVLFIATAMSSVWAFFHAYAIYTQAFSPFLNFIVELLFATGWLVFLSTLLGGVTNRKRFWFIRYGGIIIAGLVSAVGAGLRLAGQLYGFEPNLGLILAIGCITISFHLLVTIEQIYRNARRKQRQELVCLNLGVAVIFAYTLALYTNALFTGTLSSAFWDGRGFVVALSGILIADSARHSPSWAMGLFVSRQVVFFSATTVLAVFYAVIVIVISLLIRSFAGQWGAALQLVFLVVAVLGSVMLLIAEKPRSKLRVMISKNFFDSKYDYREQWQHLIDTLTSSKDGLSLRKRCIKSVAEILASPSGTLWLEDPNSHKYHCVESWSTQCGGESRAKTDPLVVFLQTKGWVVDLRELAEDPERYGILEAAAGCAAQPDAGYVVPLIHEASLMGFMILARSERSLVLNFEDHDLLKRTGKQIASYLTQEIATEQLAEAKQFEAFNRLTAYIMHDLKNVLAQQSLIVDNAKMHKGSPEFIDDAIATLRSGMQRMRKVIEHLQQKSINYRITNVELGELCMRVISGVESLGRKPTPQIRLDDKRLWVRVDREGLQMAVRNAVQNAQDATGTEGSVAVIVRRNGDNCEVIVEDDGVGMSQDFIRERLFRPFDGTKGTQGMGIGMYQIREAMLAAGGAVNIESEEGVGTRVTLQLPVAHFGENAERSVEQR